MSKRPTIKKKTTKYETIKKNQQLDCLCWQAGGNEQRKDGRE